MTIISSDEGRTYTSTLFDHNNTSFTVPESDSSLGGHEVVGTSYVSDTAITAFGTTLVSIRQHGKALGFREAI